MSKLNDYSLKAKDYAALQIHGTALLPFRLLPTIFKKYAPIIEHVLDFGCGAGRSTRFLKEQGLNVDGVDIDPAMLQQAKTFDPLGSYQLIKDKILATSAYYDMVFSSFVFVEISSLEKIKIIFNEINRVLKPDGCFIILTVSEQFFEHEWNSIYTNYPENKNLQSGDICKLKIKTINLELHDYFWTAKDYQAVANQAGFLMIDTLAPLADSNDKSVEWLAETAYPPYVIYVFRKNAVIPQQINIAG